MTIVYFKNELNGTFRIYDGDGCKTIPTLNKEEVCLYLHFSYRVNDEGLIKFYHDLHTWRKQIIEHIDVDIFRFGKRWWDIIRKVFLHLCPYKLIEMEPTDLLEYAWINKCHNGGLIYFNSDMRGKKQKYISYDFSKFYPTILGEKTSKFQIPTKTGNQQFLKEIPKTVKYGIYRVKISCDDPNFNKIFAINVNDHYTHTSLCNARYLQRFFDVKITLIKDGFANAYIYDDDCLVWSRKVFGYWFEKLMICNKAHPENKIVKMLMSSAHGHLCASSKMIVSEEQFEEKDPKDYFIRMVHNAKNPLQPRYKLILKEKPFRFNIARMKPFLVSLARKRMGDVILKNKADIDNIAMVHTDGITLVDNNTFLPDKKMVIEDKKTGLLILNNINKPVTRCEDD